MKVAVQCRICGSTFQTDPKRPVQTCSKPCLVLRMKEVAKTSPSAFRPRWQDSAHSTP